MPTRRHLLAAAAALPAVAFFSGTSHAAEPEIFAREGVAINGFDPVAYFTEGAPVKGGVGHSTEHMGATWYFSSAGNKAAFEAAPARYAPQFGGYCAYAVSRGYTAPTDPDAWTVHDGKLYLNFSLRARDLWSEDIPGNIARGEANWPAVLEQ